MADGPPATEALIRDFKRAWRALPDADARRAALRWIHSPGAGDVEEPWLTAGQFAKHCGVTIKTVRRWIREHQIVVHRVGHTRQGIRIAPSQLNWDQVGPQPLDTPELLSHPSKVGR